MENEGITHDTPVAIRAFEESNLALQSPVLAQSPFLPTGAPSQRDDVKLGGSMKRSRADIATPRKPGTMEARMQESMEFISTPARAPPAMKRLMRDGSPVSRRASLENNSPDGLCSLPPEQESGGSLVSATQSLSVAQSESVVSPPKFSLAMDESDSDMAVDKPETQRLSMLATSDFSSDDPFSISRPVSEAPVASSAALASPDLSWLKPPQRQSQDSEATIVKEEEQLKQYPVAATSCEKLDAEPKAETPFGKPNMEPKAESSEAMDTDNHLSAASNGSAQMSDASLAAAKFAAAVADATNEDDTDASNEQNDVALDIDSESEIKAAPADVKGLSKTDFTKQSDVDKLEESVFSSEMDMKDVSEDTKENETILIPSQVSAASYGERPEQPELTTAKILSDPDLMYAAAIPLPGTPASGNQMKTPAKSAKAKDAADFMIPTDWLMDPSPSGRRLKQYAESPLKRFSSPNGENTDNLIPVTPANQKLLDSLEIQWMTPSRVPKFSDTEMDALRTEYEEKMSRQNELREKLLETLKNEYSTNMRKQQDMAEQTLKEAEDMFQKMIEHKEREFAEKLAEEQKKHSEEIARRDEESRVQAAELLRELENVIAERDEHLTQKDEVRAMLNDYVATSSRLIEDKENEGLGLTRELGKLTLERQRLQEQLEGANTLIETLTNERTDAHMRAESLSAETSRLEDLAKALRNDVLVAEERSSKIREYAEDTLAKANSEITSLQEHLSASHQENATLKTQSTKAEARARSLQIQLDSAKRQNEELLALCNNL
ncbi:hypothetical protein IW140_006239 [Coemansia sp. RSA 1813]|nr:Transforming acidic coiled-coil-containing protein 2 [Coemansia sp. RSA 1646]KAJ1765642.1 hypothetical protein LPJ74_006274 [Coemansia sp. RSA 1843]KAJ2085725.1 hypothetical protein IW138_006148 [Coemansia sp. RSA 986]KAJ2210493.1 hypothetical protein EV179_006198 [Coemansia sp. RSA 487]KAJ2563058.1 hypothetical protein IW140_006239 [Coemansia sp. RSA 1813]